MFDNHFLFWTDIEVSFVTKFIFQNIILTKFFFEILTFISVVVYLRPKFINIYSFTITEINFFNFKNNPSYTACFIGKEIAFIVVDPKKEQIRR